MKAMFGNKIAIFIGVVLVFNLLQGCSRRSRFETLIGSPVVESRVDTGAGFRREYYVYSRSVGDAGKVFDSICSKISAKFSDSSVYNPGVMKFEIGKLGYLPDISRWFDAKYTSNLTRYYSLESKDRMSTIDVYETEKYVCLIVADG